MKINYLKKSNVKYIIKWTGDNLGHYMAENGQWINLHDKYDKPEIFNNLEEARNKCLEIWDDKAIDENIQFIIYENDI